LTSLLRIVTDPAGVGGGLGVARGVGEPAAVTVDERVRVTPTCGGHGNPEIGVPAGNGVPAGRAGVAVQDGDGMAVDDGVGVTVGDAVGVEVGDGDGDGVDVGVSVEAGVAVGGGATVGEAATVVVMASADVMPVDDVRATVAVIGTVAASDAVARVRGKVAVTAWVGDIALVLARAMIWTAAASVALAEAIS
jgi:hypothetical protein